MTTSVANPVAATANILDPSTLGPGLNYIKAALRESTDAARHGRAQPPSPSARLAAALAASDKTTKTAASEHAGSKLASAVTADTDPAKPAEKTFFDEVLDVINPLQHLPIVSTLYRAETHDAISAIPRILGGALYGGPIGAATSAIDSLFAWATGKDFGATVLALVDGNEADAPDNTATQLAAVAKPSSVSAADGGEARTVSNTTPNGILTATQAHAPNRPRSVPATGPILPASLRVASGRVFSGPRPSEIEAGAGPGANRSGPEISGQIPVRIPSGPNPSGEANAASFADKMMGGLDRYRAMAKLPPEGYRPGTHTDLTQ